MKTFILTDEEADLLETELIHLGIYHESDDGVHKNDCGSKVLGVIQYQLEMQKID